jgi:CDP-diacylglycerol--glycerol-3-phosphate 3-phosphatidyltransferase
VSTTSAAPPPPSRPGSEPVPARTFGPSALATPANALTLARLLASPVLVGLVAATGHASWLLAVLWLVCAGSDGVDGIVARKMGATRSGAFLDPLADKFLVIGVMFALVGIGSFDWLPVVLITAREIAMSAYRARAGRRGISIPARVTAKAKTFVQDVVVGLALLPPVGLHHLDVVRDLLWVAVALTLYSGVEYYLDARRLASAMTRSDSSAGTSSAPAVAGSASAATGTDSSAGAS